MATPLIWMPLNGNMDNLGIGTVVKTSTAAPEYYADGKIGKAYNLNVRSVFTCEELSGLTSFSICFWAKTLPSETQTANWQDIVCFYDVTKSGTNGYFRWESGYGTSSSIHGAHWHDNAANAIVDGSFTHFTERNVWHHCAVTVENGVSLKSFTDGMLKSTITTKLGGGHLRGDFHIGETNAIEGAINDLRVYDHALSEKEIHDISKALVLHYPLDNNGFGGENLVLNSDFSKDFTSWSKPWGSATGHSIYTDANGKKWCHYLSETTSTTYKYGGIAQTPGLVIKPGTKYTVSADMFASDDTSGIFWFHWMSTEGGGNIGQQNKTFSITTFPQRYYYTFTSTTSETYEINRFRLMIGTGYGTNTTSYDVYLSNIKIEEGSVSTPWSPASSEISDRSVVYDCSGFHNDAVLNDITFDADTPRYEVSSEFDASTTSYVKVTDNKWMAQGAPEITINFWANPATWSGQTKYFSCTESGGFNTEGGTSGYIRFPNHVYTNAALTSTAYKYSSTELRISDIPAGWHMITFVKNLEGNKVYIDGELHSSYNFVNYGEHFNLNARLFLGCEASTANPSGPYYTGMMSDFRLYYTELSPEDIKELYEVGASIDNLQNMHTHWYIEDPTYSNPSITKTGIVKENELEEADKASLFSSGKITAKEIIEI